MLPTAVRAAAGARTPLIQFLGKHRIPQNIDHTPRAHPAAPSQSLPSSFAEYRKAALQHGPLARKATPVEELRPGDVFDRNQLPKRFWRLGWTKHEMEVVESGGAAAFA